MKVGKDAVAMGNIPPNSQIGDGSVVIGATDNNGNVNLTQPMAVGRNARAGKDSIAIGANASAGVSVEDLTAKLASTGLPADEIQKLIQAINTDRANGVSPLPYAGETQKWFTKLTVGVGVVTNITNILHSLGFV